MVCFSPHAHMPHPRILDQGPKELTRDQDVADRRAKYRALKPFRGITRAIDESIVCTVRQSSALESLPRGRNTVRLAESRFRGGWDEIYSITRDGTRVTPRTVYTRNESFPKFAVLLRPLSKRKCSRDRRSQADSSLTRRTWRNSWKPIGESL